LRETPNEFQRRTGHRYAPSDELRAFGRHLRPDEAVPTLFRFPGACGMAAFLGLEPAPATLGPEGQPHAWLTHSRNHSFSAGAQQFGTLVVLQPLRFSPWFGEYNRPPIDATGQVLPVWALPNRPITDEDAVVWIPASALETELPWDTLCNASELPDWSAEKRQAIESLHRYREEMFALKQAGEPPLPHPWFEVPASQRTALLERHAIPCRWTA